MVPVLLQPSHEVLQFAQLRAELGSCLFDSSYQRLVGLLPGLAFEDFVVDRAVSVDRADRRRVVRAHV